MVCSHVGYYVTCVGPVFHTGFLSSLRHHAFHSESFLGVVEAEERGLAETQHTACAQTKTTVIKCITLYIKLMPLESISNDLDHDPGSFRPVLFRSVRGMEGGEEYLPPFYMNKQEHLTRWCWIRLLAC